MRVFLTAPSINRMLLRAVDRSDRQPIISFFYGYKRLNDLVEKELKRSGIEVITDFERRVDADIELNISAPFEAIKPTMHPAIKFTMWEFRDIPRWIVDCIISERWERILVPSRFCNQVFRSHGINSYYSPIGIDDKFKYLERDWDIEPLRVLTIVSAIPDRKCGHRIIDYAFENEIPGIQFVVKSSPFRSEAAIDEVDLPQLQVINRKLDDQEFIELLGSCHVSLNISAGEGYGMLPVECAATGMYTAIHALTGYSEFVHGPFYKLEAEWRYFYDFEGTGAYVDKSEIDKFLAYCLANRDRLEKLGFKLSQWVRANCLFKDKVEYLIKHLENVIENYPSKKIVPLDQLHGMFRKEAPDFFELWEAIIEDEIKTDT